MWREYFDDLKLSCLGLGKKELEEENLFIRQRPNPATAGLASIKVRERAKKERQVRRTNFRKGSR